MALKRTRSKLTFQCTTCAGGAAPTRLLINQHPQSSAPNTLLFVTLLSDQFAFAESAGPGTTGHYDAGHLVDGVYYARDIKGRSCDALNHVISVSAKMLPTPLKLWLRL